jgi:hypothetical protein
MRIEMSWREFVAAVEAKLAASGHRPEDVMVSFLDWHGGVDPEIIVKPWEDRENKPYLTVLD